MQHHYRIQTFDELHMAAGEVLQVLHSLKTSRAIVLGLSGDLGAGKTTFVQALARELGVTDAVTSPTYIIMKTYETSNTVFQTLVHIDAYRIETIDEMEVLGFREVLEKKDTIICIEWPEHIASLLPPDIVQLTFSIDENGARTLTLTN